MTVRGKNSCRRIVIDGKEYEDTLGCMDKTYAPNINDNYKTHILTEQEAAEREELARKIEMRYKERKFKKGKLQEKEKEM